MYCIAICEDNAQMCQTLCDLCGSILSQRGVEYEVTGYPSAQALAEAIFSGSEAANLLLLDIQMEGMSGMDLARALRRAGSRISIVFVTVSRDYLLEGYGVQPLQYLLKPVTREALAEAIDVDFRLNVQARNLIIRSAGRKVSLPIQDIQYIESRDHSVIMHMTDSERRFALSLTEIESYVPAGQFCRCHKSFLVKLSGVAEVGRMELLLHSGVRIPIGRKYASQFQSAWIHYLNQ